MHRSSVRSPLFDLNRCHQQRGKYAPAQYSLPKLSPSIQAPTRLPQRYGLQTPPEDVMGTTYQQPQYGTYNGGHSDVQYHSGVRSGAHHDYGSSNSNRGASALQQTSTLALPIPSNKMDASVTYATYSRPASPPKAERHEESYEHHKSSSHSRNDQIMSNLQIPHTISPKGGSLAEFAAQVSGSQSERI